MRNPNLTTVAIQLQADIVKAVDIAKSQYGISTRAGLVKLALAEWLRNHRPKEKSPTTLLRETGKTYWDQALPQLEGVSYIEGSTRPAVQAYAALRKVPPSRRSMAQCADIVSLLRYAWLGEELPEHLAHLDDGLPPDHLSVGK